MVRVPSNEYIDKYMLPDTPLHRLICLEEIADAIGFIIAIPRSADNSVQMQLGTPHRYRWHHSCGKYTSTEAKPLLPP